MKNLFKITSVLFLSLLAQVSFAQSYHVLRVMGNVKDAKSNQAIKSGGRLQGTEKLVFSNKTDKILLMNAKAGKFILTPKGAKTNNNGELEVFVNDYLGTYEKKNMKLSTRGRSGKVTNLKDYFTDKKHYIIGDTLHLELAENVYPVDENRVLLMAIKVEDVKKRVVKRISLKDQTVTIIKSQLFSQNGQPIDPYTVEDVKVYYYRDFAGARSDKDMVVNFLPIFVDEQELVEEIQEMIEFLRMNDFDESKIKDEIKQFMWDAYGSFDEKILFETLKKHGVA